MKLERVVDYKVNFKSIWPQYSAALMGVFLFLRMVYYFAFADVLTCGKSELWLQLIIPGVLAIGYMVILRGIRLNVPLVYGGLITALCAVFVICGFQLGTLRGVLSLVLYLIAAAVMFVTMLGFVTNRLYLVIAYILPVVIRLVVFDLILSGFNFGSSAILLELSTLAALGAFACFMPGIAAEKS